MEFLVAPEGIVRVDAVGDKIAVLTVTDAMEGFGPEVWHSLNGIRTPISEIKADTPIQAAKEYLSKVAIFGPGHWWLDCILVNTEDTCAVYEFDGQEGWQVVYHHGTEEAT